MFNDAIAAVSNRPVVLGFSFIFIPWSLLTDNGGMHCRFYRGNILDDIVIDAPKALDLMAIMLMGAHLHEDKERIERLAGKSMDNSDQLLSKLSS